MDQLSMPTPLIVDMIFECSCHPQPHLLDDIEESHKLVGAAFVTAGSALPQTIGGGCDRFGCHPEIILHFSPKGCQSYAIHASP
jgi:hypothetical protein